MRTCEVDTMTESGLTDTLLISLFLMKIFEVAQDIVAVLAMIVLVQQYRKRRLLQAERMKAYVLDFKSLE